MMNTFKLCFQIKLAPLHKGFDSRWQPLKAGPLNGLPLRNIMAVLEIMLDNGAAAGAGEGRQQVARASCVCKAWLCAALTVLKSRGIANRKPEPVQLEVTPEVKQEAEEEGEEAVKEEEEADTGVEEAGHVPGLKREEQPAGVAGGAGGAEDEGRDDGAGSMEECEERGGGGSGGGVGGGGGGGGGPAAEEGRDGGGGGGGAAAVVRRGQRCGECHTCLHPLLKKKCLNNHADAGASENDGGGGSVKEGVEGGGGGISGGGGSGSQCVDADEEAVARKGPKQRDYAKEKERRAWNKLNAKKVWTHGQCSPRHQMHFDPRLLTHG
jgi:hypothetical protein